MKYIVWLLILYAVFLLCSVNTSRSKSRRVGDGMLVPHRRHLMKLEVFKDKVANRIWKPFYFGSNLPEEFIFFRGEFRYTFNDDGQTLLTELSGRLPNGTCVDETTFFNQMRIAPQKVISRKADFIGESYRAFFSSDPDSYLLSVECVLNKRLRRCHQDNYFISLLVKDSRPDSVPLHRALRDLWRATCLKLDSTPGDFRFLFMFGDNTCP